MIDSIRYSEPLTCGGPKLPGFSEFSLQLAARSSFSSQSHTVCGWTRQPIVTDRDRVSHPNRAILFGEFSCHELQAVASMLREG
ncbi:hypothetical protein AVEN_151710-1 [Araneus ventricosus]|uniref:Uncharacterized protein n=1 Tax=Araneus ventricosus TaxID=182803 RepID=A0A4Y2DPN3_ARAVE|nr:hypothetical protein AVEN_151710-1 [Araneus ventricosus]